MTVLSPGDAEGTNPDKTMCKLPGASSDVLGFACKIPVLDRNGGTRPK
eukprot:gene20747-7662_t